MIREKIERVNKNFLVLRVAALWGISPTVREGSIILALVMEPSLTAGLPPRLLGLLATRFR